jgi:hypothetical protein
LGKVFGWLLLFGVCALAWTWQVRWSDGVRAARESLRSTPAGLHEREASWGRITVGRPSGSEPLVDFPPAEVPEDPAPRPATGGGAPSPFLTPREETPGVAEPPAPPVWEDAEYVVPRGAVLSRICQDYYGSGRPPIPERVAQYNGLDSPDDLREGQVLRLPEWEALFPEGRERPAGASRERSAPR